ncbi:MAG TPA: sugar transferase [Gaiellaceae bacterium]|nr:sugar transferase [Gaiellaceae bacterium]
MNVVTEELVSRRALREPRRLGHGRTWILAASDVAALAAAVVVAFLAASVLRPLEVDAPLLFLLTIAALAVPIWLTLFTAYRLYDQENRRLTTASFDEVRDIFHVLLAGSLLALLGSQVVEAASGWHLLTVVEVTAFVPSALLLVPLARGAVRSWVFPRVMRPRRALIVGGGPEAELVRRKLGTHPEYGLDVVGVLDDAPSDRSGGDFAEEIAAAIDWLEVDRVLLASSVASHEEMLDFIRAVRRPDLQVSIVPRYFEIFTSNADLDELEGMPLVTLPPMRLDRSSRLLKRLVDVVVSGTLLLVLSPLLLAIAVAIRLDSPGPVIYRQPRRGRDDTTFRIAKFRSMHTGAEERRSDVLHLNEVDGPLFKVKKGDPRVTRVGAVLRRTSLDELPQLWNVLRGEMSLVGPRPFVVYEADKITGWARRRLDMTPGITGLWQVLGRNDIPFDEMVKLDYIYVTNWSPWWDFKIICQTIPVVLGRRGAY